MVKMPPGKPVPVPAGWRDRYPHLFRKG
jgi:hypothetical protein